MNKLLYYIMDSKKFITYVWINEDGISFSKNKIKITIGTTSNEHHLKWRIRSFYSGYY